MVTLLPGKQAERGLGGRVIPHGKTCHFLNFALLVPFLPDKLLLFMPRLESLLLSVNL